MLSLEKLIQHEISLKTLEFQLTQPKDIVASSVMRYIRNEYKLSVYEYLEIKLKP